MYIEQCRISVTLTNLSRMDNDLDASGADMVAFWWWLQRPTLCASYLSLPGWVDHIVNLEKTENMYIYHVYSQTQYLKDGKDAC